MFNFFHKIGPTFAANIFNQLTVILTQIVIMPIMIGALGVHTFGMWLVLAAIPAYLSISDLGFSYSAKSDMSVRMAAGDVKGAIETLSSVTALMTLVMGAFALVYIGVTFLVGWTSVFDLKGMSIGDARTILLFGLIDILATQAYMISAATLRANRQPALEAFFGGALRLAESTALVAGAFVTHNLVIAAACWALTRLALTVIIIACTLIFIPLLRPVMSAIKKERMVELFRPSMAFMLMPLANSFLLQGSTLILSAGAGASVVAAFNIFRTVTRMGVSVGNTLNYTFVPQYSYSWGAKNTAAYFKLFRIHLGLLLAGCAAYMLAQAVGAKFFVDILSHHQVKLMPWAFGLLLVSAVLEMGWSVPLTLGSANNHVAFLTTVYVALAGVFLAGFSLLGAMGIHSNAVAQASGLMIVNLVMVVVGWVWAVRYLNGFRTAPLKVEAEKDGPVSLSA